MQATTILQEFQRLPLEKKFWVIEEAIKSIKQDEMNHKMEMAVNELSADYNNDKELTAFTSLDFENFYETR